MRKLNAILKKVFTNPPILYIISRYATYLVLFINTLFIALYLGPYFLGIWGFINLVLNYLTQINFGITHSVNVIISVNKEKEEYVQKVIGNGLSMILFLSILIILFFTICYLFDINVGEKYNFNAYIILVSIIAIISHYNVLLTSIFRVYGNVFAMAINQSLFPLLQIFIIPFFREQNLLWALVLTNLISVTISLSLYIYKSPTKLKFLLDLDIIKYIQKKGLNLFIYNSSFSLILITTRSFISNRYSIDEFGYFTFAYSLSQGILLFLNAISYLIFPKLLNRFALADNNHIRINLNSVRTAYISTSHLLIHLVIMIFPVIILVFPEFTEASEIFKITALTIVLYTNSFGYETLLMARGRENKIAKIAFSALLVNVFLVAISVYVLKVKLSFVMFATMIVYFLYVLIISLEGRKELGLSPNILKTINEVFNFRIMIPFTISIILILKSFSGIYFLIPFVLFIILNIKDIVLIKSIGIRVIKNPNFINI